MDNLKSDWSEEGWMTVIAVDKRLMYRVSKLYLQKPKRDIEDRKKKRKRKREKSKKKCRERDRESE